MTATFTLVIERKYGDSPSNWWPAFGGMEKGEAEDALKTYPAVYGEVSRQLVPEKPELRCSEAFLRSCNG